MKKILLLVFAYMLVSAQVINAMEVNNHLRIGGIAGLIYYDQDNDKDGKSVKDYYDFHPVYIDISTMLNDTISGFIEVEYEHIPQFKGGTTVTGAGEIK